MSQHIAYSQYKTLRFGGLRSLSETGHMRFNAVLVFPNITN